MKVDLYDYAYERSYKNVIGPGPAAYSEMYRGNSTDQYQKTQFSKASRKLTQGEPGPGPSLYASHYSKDKQTLVIHPRPKFPVATRKIDVIKCKFEAFSSFASLRV